MTKITPQKPPTARLRTYRDRKWLDSAKGRVCDVESCLDTDTVVFAHMRRGSEGGMGLKPSDYLGAWLCHQHHMEQEAQPGFDWWARNILKVLMRERYTKWSEG